MLPSIKAEFLKLFTIRSTYIIIALSVLIALIFAGYTEGFKANYSMLSNPGWLASEVTSGINSLAIFCGIVAVLLFSHEYRYNTIMHTLTSTNRRSKVLASKILAMSVFSVGFALFVGIIAPLFAYIGAQLAGHDSVAQNIPYLDLLWRAAFTFWAYAMFGLLFVAITRNQIFSIVALFFMPVIEGTVGTILKSNAKYEPFTAINFVISPNGQITPANAALVVAIQLAAYWAIAWYLFLRRDATNGRA